MMSAWIWLPLLASLVEPVDLTVDISARGERGYVYCAAWAAKEGFPTQKARAVGEGRALIRKGRGRMRIQLPTGDGVALACFHDENENQRLDTGLFGIPTEGTGASNDARPKLGPPSYEDARFPLTSSSTVAVVIHY